MTTRILTPKQPHPVTGLQNSYLAWHFTGSTAMDVFEGVKFVQYGGWGWDIHPDPDNPSLQRLTLIKDSTTIFIRDTEWFAFDGLNVIKLPEQVVNENYDIETWSATTQPEEEQNDDEES